MIVKSYTVEKKPYVIYTDVVEISKYKHTGRFMLKMIDGQKLNLSVFEVKLEVEL